VPTLCCNRPGAARQPITRRYLLTALSSLDITAQRRHANIGKVTLRSFSGCPAGLKRIAAQDQPVEGCARRGQHDARKPTHRMSAAQEAFGSIFSEQPYHRIETLGERGIRSGGPFLCSVIEEVIAHRVQADERKTSQKRVTVGWGQMRTGPMAEYHRSPPASNAGSKMAVVVASPTERSTSPTQ